MSIGHFAVLIYGKPPLFEHLYLLVMVDQGSEEPAFVIRTGIDGL